MSISPYRIPSLSNLELKSSEEIKKELANLENNFNERSNELKIELEKRKLIIKLEGEKLRALETFRKYNNTSDIIFYKENTTPFLLNKRLIFYGINIAYTHQKIGYVYFNELTMDVCTLLDLKFVLDNGSYYIKETKNIKLTNIMSSLNEITKISFEYQRLFI